MITHTVFPGDSMRYQRILNPGVIPREMKSGNNYRGSRIENLVSTPGNNSKGLCRAEIGILYIHHLIFIICIAFKEEGNMVPKYLHHHSHSYLNNSRLIYVMVSHIEESSIRRWLTDMHSEFKGVYLT